MDDNDKTGIEKLRELKNVRMASAVRGETIPCRPVSDEAIDYIADQIEREHAEEVGALNREIDRLADNRKALVAEAKRNQECAARFHRERDKAFKEMKRMERREGKLTDEARDAVERLRRLDGNDVYDQYVNGWQNNWKVIEEAIGADCSRVRTYQEDLNSVRDRLIELIEHGCKQDVDVAALLELADDLESLEVSASSAEFASGYEDGCEYAAERIRKAVEGAPEADAESDSERACAALLDWRDQVAGLLGIDCGSMADEVQDAIMAELDKRLMPPGMEWPKFEDGEPVMMGDEIITHSKQISNVTSVRFNEDGSFVCYKWGGRPDRANISGSDAKRPEPEVLGADGEPIKVGETVYDRLGGTFYVFEITHGGIETTCGYLSASEVTHTPPDTQARIDGDATLDPATYCDEVLGWAADKIVLHSDYAAQNEAMIADLLRRQRELDAKTAGGE